MGFTIEIERNRNGFTPLSATPYTLSIEVDGASIWSTTVNPLDLDPQFFYVSLSPPWDAAIFRARITVNSDASHPHVVQGVGIDRFGSFVLEGALPVGYVPTQPSTLQCAIPSDPSSSDYHGKGVYSAYSSSYHSGASPSMHSGIIGMDSGLNKGPIKRVPYDNEIRSVCCVDSFLDTDGNGGPPVRCAVDSSGVVDFHGVTGSAGAVASLFDIVSNADWGRDGGTGSIDAYDRDVFNHRHPQSAAAERWGLGHAGQDDGDMVSIVYLRQEDVHESSYAACDLGLV
jgi:hypothetical protein